jgi:hypothetical protein
LHTRSAIFGCGNLRSRANSSLKTLSPNDWANQSESNGWNTIKLNIGKSKTSSTGSSGIFQGLRSVTQSSICSFSRNDVAVNDKRRNHTLGVHWMLDLVKIIIFSFSPSRVSFRMCTGARSQAAVPTEMVSKILSAKRTWPEARIADSWETNW